MGKNSLGLEIDPDLGFPSIEKIIENWEKIYLMLG